ncbi:MAG: aldo/keto reductase [Paracoccaceae bacterium]|nr:aldo/keto reductase [Paracoccaceae bacterium]
MNIYFQNKNQRAFGTFPLTGDVARNAILTAAEVGYRAFDTAQMYENEAETGEALADTGLARDELCITTKVHPDNYSEDKFIPSVEASLKALRTDYVDVLLLHWPPADGGDIAPSLRLLQDALKRGLTRNIGVSNYTVAMMREAVNIVDAPIVTNQVEFHPLLNQDVLMAGASEVGIPLSSYSSVARGEVFKHPEFAEIGKPYGKSAGQVVLRWIVQKGVSVNTMSTNPDNIRANFEIMDFTLSHVDMARIEKLTHTGYRIVTKDLVPWAPEWD